MKYLAVVFLVFTWYLPARAQTELPVITYEIPSAGGWVVSPDLTTLIVSSPETAELYYIDTVTAAAPRKVRVPFKPERLALQGDQLFVTVQSSTLVYALDASTGKSLRRYKLPGTAVHHLACHPEKGPVFVSSADEEIVVLDPESTTVKKTTAQGSFLAVDPREAKYLYTATNRPSQDVVEAARGIDGAVQFRRVTIAQTAAVLKYETGEDDLKLVGGNSNTAVGAGGYLHVSPDGTRYVMVAGGGWRSPTNLRLHQDMAVFETEDMTTMLGGLTCGAPQVSCFHPVLDLGVAQGNNVDFYTFDAVSLIHRNKRTVKAPGVVKFWLNTLAFGGRGTRIITLQGNYLHLIPLELKKDELTTLEEKFGRLPDLTRGGSETP